MASYRQLGFEERVKIETLSAKGHSGNAIAPCLGRSQSTISRELGRNRECASRTARCADRPSRRAVGRRPRSARGSLARRTGSDSRSA